jgi:hypothetical protein
MILYEIPLNPPLPVHDTKRITPTRTLPHRGGGENLRIDFSVS